MDCCWTVKKKESEKMDVPPTTLTEKDDMDDQEFMVWLYNHYEERMLRTAKKYCRDAFLWEEILQESFLRLLSRIPKLRALKEGERVGYLTVTVRNTAFTLLRKQAKERGWCVSLETGCSACGGMPAGGMGHSKRTVEYVGRCLASACPHRAFFAGGTVFPAEK